MQSGATRRASATPLEEALSYLATPGRERTGVILDVKEEDTAADLVTALDAAGLTRRTIACARSVAALHALGDLQPALRRAWSLKRARHAAAARLAAARRDVPAAVGAALHQGLAEVVSVHRSLVTARLVTMVHSSGGEIYVWDVTGEQQALTLGSLGVDALIGDDPERLRAWLIGASCVPP